MRALAGIRFGKIPAKISWLWVHKNVRLESVYVPLTRDEQVGDGGQQNLGYR